MFDNIFWLGWTAHDQCRICLDDTQNIIEVMSYACRELAHICHVCIRHLAGKLTLHEIGVCLCQYHRTLPNARANLSIKLPQLLFHSYPPLVCVFSVWFAAK